MVTMQNITGLFSEKEILNMLVKKMEEVFDDFADTKRRYEEAMATLAAESSHWRSVAVQEVQEAVQKKVISILFFSAFLGFWANLQYFFDPVSQDFLNEDFDVFLHEKDARALPEYVSAQSVCDKFYAQISLEQAEKYENVIAYTSYLETIGPKIAHFFGYSLGNKLLYRLVPGYRSDMVHTLRYRMLLEGYLGQNIDWIS